LGRKRGREDEGQRKNAPRGHGCARPGPICFNSSVTAASSWMSFAL
jgi:hypothetical protein